ncbi:unnamed protein product [Brassica oleracea var. botrytis]
MNEDYVENLRHRTSKYLAAMKALEEKADKIAELCDAQVGVICYPTDNLTPLFYGRPRFQDYSIDIPQNVYSKYGQFQDVESL